MPNQDILKDAFRRHKERCSKHSAGFALAAEVKSLAYSFIKDAVSGDDRFEVEDIIEACESVLKEG